MPRRPMPRGTHGKITVKQLGPKSFCANAYYRNGRGELERMRRWGTSKTDAEGNLKQALLDVAKKIKRTELDPSCRVARAAKLWEEELDRLVDEGLISWDTARNYIGCLNNQIVPNIGQLQLCELDPGECDNLFAQVRRTTSLSRARFTRTVLGLLCKFAIRKGGFTTNPVDMADDIRTGSDRPEPKRKGITPEEWKEMMSKLRVYISTKEFDKNGSRRGKRSPLWPMMTDILDAQVATGGRIGEIICIVGDNIDLSAKTVTLDTHWGRVRGQGMVRLPRRKGGEPSITIHVPDGSIPMWRRLKLASGGGLVFKSRSGGLINRSQLLGYFREAFTACGYDWLVSHQTRKSSAKRLRASGMPDEDVARQLGNTASVARKHYLEEDDNLNPAAALALQAFFE